MKLTILMSVYNENLAMIKEAVDSILNQTYSDFEFMIVNDNPLRNDLKNLLAEYAKNDERIVLITNPKNIGLQASLKQAVERINSPYIARMDADDISCLDRIEKQMQCIETGEFDVVSSWVNFIDENGEAFNQMGVNVSGEIESQDLLEANVITHPSALFKRETIIKAGNYRDIKYAEDYDLWLRVLANRGRLYMIDEPLINYRIRGDGISVSNRAQQLLTVVYVQKLFLERLETGSDSHSSEKLAKFLEDNLKGYDLELTERSFEKLKEARTLAENGNKLKALVIRLSVFLKDPVYRKNYLQKLKMRKVKL